MRGMSGDFLIFQQDSAPAHRARDTVQVLEQSTPTLIPPDPWPPNSTNLNPVDYKMRGDIQQAHQSQLHNIDELEKRLLKTLLQVYCGLLDVLHGMDHSVIDDAIETGQRVSCVLATVVNFTIASNDEPHDKICFVSSNVMFVICRKFEH